MIRTAIALIASAWKNQFLNMEYDDREAGQIATQSRPSPLLQKLLQKRARGARGRQKQTPLSNDWPYISLYELRLPLKANKRFSSTKIKELKPHLWQKLSDMFLSLKCVFETDERHKEIKKEKKPQELDIGNKLLGIQLSLCIYSVLLFSV